MPGEPPMRETPCRECGGMIRFAALPDDAPFAWLLPRICNACTPIVEARDAATEAAWQKQEADKRREKRIRDWDTICPANYRETDLRRVPASFAAAIESYRFGPKGLGFCAPTGERKTRTMFVLLHRLFVVEGKRSIYLTASDFSHKVSRLSGDRMEALDEFVGGLCRVPVLFLDDLGKGRNTDRVEAEMYHVIEKRTANQLPILFTAQLTGKDFAASMGEDRGAAIVRRLGEFCEIVKP